MKPFALATFAFATLTAACSIDIQSGSDTSDVADGSGGGDAGGGSADSSTGATNPTSGSGGSGAQPVAAEGELCGTRGAAECAEGLFCAFAADADCGALDGGGTCAKRPEACTAQFDPVCGCDGKTYSNGCTAASYGQSVASDGACPGDEPEPEPGVCGGKSGGQCAATEFCAYPLEAACGTFDATGTCAPKPEACTYQYDPVCGCDGQTYGNACEASSAGVSVAAQGECGGTVEPGPVDGVTCGGLTGLGCAEGEFCNYPIEAQCGAADQMGTCEEIPSGCTKEGLLVCGCDGQTYGNPCMAKLAGVSVASKSACAPSGSN